MPGRILENTEFNQGVKDIGTIAQNIGKTLNRVRKNKAQVPSTTTRPSTTQSGLTTGTKTKLGTVTTPYGGSTNFEKFHPGLDLASPMGTKIPSFTSGVVTEVIGGKKQGDKGYGNTVVITDEQGNKLRYSHLNQSYVKVGQQVPKGYVLGGLGNCFDKQTEVLTNKGWKKFSDLDKTETVATLNIKTKEIQYQKPTAYIDKTYDKMYKFKNGHKNIDFVVSEDHNMLIQLHQNQQMKLKQLKDLPNRSYIRLKNFKWSGKEVDEYIIPEIEVKINQFNYTKKIPKINIKMDTWLEFLGWWLSDGSMCNTGVNNAVIITQSFNNIKKRIKIKRLLKKLPFNFSACKNGDFLITSAILHSDLWKYGQKNKKCIPKFVFNLSPRQIRIFLDAYWLGDGWQHKKTKYYIFGEKQLADQVQELILKAGGYGIINEFDPLKRKNKAFINKREVKATKKYWVITETKYNFCSIVKNKIEEINYNDHAYCLTVNNHTLYVRRNGKAMFCGNTGSTYSLHGGDASHLDIRIKNIYDKYVNPSSFLEGFL